MVGSQQQSDQIRQKPLIVLLTGATGYIGGRLIPLLQMPDLTLRCLARNPDTLRWKVAAQAEVVQGDVLDRFSLEVALTGVTTAYYLVHSMGSSGGLRKEGPGSCREFWNSGKTGGGSEDHLYGRSG